MEDWDQSDSRERVKVWLVDSLSVEVEKEIWRGPMWGQEAETALCATLGSLKHMGSFWVSMRMYDWGKQEVKLCQASA